MTNRFKLPTDAEREGFKRKTERLLALQELAKEEGYRVGSAQLLTKVTAIVTFATGILWHPWWWSVAAGVVAYVVTLPLYRYLLVRRWQRTVREQFKDLDL